MGSKSAKRRARQESRKRNARKARMAERRALEAQHLAELSVMNKEYDEESRPDTGMVDDARATTQDSGRHGEDDGNGIAHGSIRKARKALKNSDRIEMNRRVAELASSIADGVEAGGTDNAHRKKTDRGDTDETPEIVNSSIGKIISIVLVVGMIVSVGVLGVMSLF